MLLSYVGDKSCIQRLPEISIITNELVLELVKFKQQHSVCTFKLFHLWITDLYGVKWPQSDSPTCQAITRSVERLSSKLVKIKKQHSSAEKQEVISDFLQHEYVLPKLGFCKGRIVNFSPAKKSKASHDLALQGGYIEMYKDAKQKMYAMNRNANKRLKRKEAVIHRQKDCILSQQKTLLKYERKVLGTESQLKKLKAKLDRVNHRAAYWKTKAAGICLRKGDPKLRDEILLLKKEVAALDLSNAELNETIQSILSEPEIITFENGRYTDDVRACIYELLALNVGVRNVAPIVCCVLKNIAHKSVSRLPSYGLTCQMILESLTIAQAQLGDRLSESGFSTLQTDGTTKFGEHYATYDVRVPESEITYSLGLRHVFSGSSHDTLETLKQILSDVDNVQLAIGKDAVSSKIVSQIKNTMSDRHSAEKLFNEMLHDFRAEILPAIVENWEDLADVEKEQMTRMNNFFCGLHYLVGLAECTDETIKVWEANSDSECYGQSSGTQRLIRTACKAFHHRGSQQCGSSTLFRSYLRKHGVHKIPLAQFVGNRFNILFYDAAGIYYLQDHMINFIASVHGKQANRLLECVLKDLKNPTFISGCRALGLIDKIVTGPLWRKLEESSTSVLKMGSTYCEIKKKFDSWCNDASALIEGSAVCIPGTEIHKDDVWNALIQSNSTDVMAQELLQLLFRAFSTTTQRLLIDHLPGGIHHNVTEKEIIEETASVPTTNVSPERDFAVLDRLLREKPNARLIALEAMILFSHNKTSSWMEQLTDDEREKLMRAARTLAPTIRAKFKARRQELEARREEDLEKRAEAIARKELKVVKEKEKLTKQIEKYGLWTSREEVEEGIEAFVKQAKKKEVLKLQINFRHKVLSQTHPNKDVFKFSHNRKQYCVSQLKENLFLLIGVDEDEEPPISSDDNNQLEDTVLHPEYLIGKKIKHRFQVGKDLVWYNGTVLNMNSKTREYQVKYEGEDDICCFALLDDIPRGDLIVL